MCGISRASRRRSRPRRQASGGRLDILVNNAGVNVRQPAFDVSEEAWDRILDTNLKGVFFTSQAAGRVMRDQVPAGGSIINVASTMGLVGYYDRAAYSSAKGGVVNLTHALAIEWAPHQIRVNAVCPAFVNTPLVQTMLENEAIRNDILFRTPIGRVADAGGDRRRDRLPGQSRSQLRHRRGAHR